MRRVWWRQSNKKGFSLVEVLVGATIITLVISGVVSTYLFYLRIGLGTPARIKASLLAEEGIEVMKYIRDGTWTNISSLTASTTYYAYFDGVDWSIVTTPTTTDPHFMRRIALYEVYRDSTGDIVSSGGSVDAGSRKLMVWVDWQTSQGTTTKSLSTYITNIFND